MPVVLYSIPVSPPCCFVRSLAKLIGVELQLKKLDLTKKEHLTPEFLKLNPFHKVPTLDDAGFVVYESIAIAYYLLRKYAPKSELYPEDIKHRTDIDRILATISCTIYPHKSAFFRTRALEGTKPSKEEVAAFEENVLKNLEHLIGDGKHAVGGKLTLADLYLVANIVAVFETGCFDRVKYQKLIDFYEHIKSKLPFFEEIYGVPINAVKQRWADLK
uniref:Putative glutathione s-transferase n=1 Tax=Amblyomma triste TaxID=251400 RepID=A0A023GG43_AMBTT